MTEGLAIEIGASMMRDRGIPCENYLLRFRHLILKPGEERTVEGNGQLLLFISPLTLVRISSKTGVFDTVTSLNEAQYVHTGTTVVRSLDVKLTNHVRFLQIIPKNT